MRSRALRLAAPAMTFLFAPAIADGQTGRIFGVSATIVPGCAVVSAAGGEWGHIDLGSIPGTTQGVVEADLLGASGGGISVECTQGSTASVTADLGEHGAGGERALMRSAGSGQRIVYQLLLEGGTVSWDAQAIPLSFSTAQPVRRLDLRGRAALSGSIAAGRYTDTVHVTITW